MKRFILGVAIASVVLFAWGFLVWGAGPYKTYIWKKTLNDEVAGQALLEHFPEAGTYFLPSPTNEPELHEKLHATGPIALVHMLSTTGRPVMDPSIMVKGYLHNVVVIVLIGLLLRQVSSALPTYLDRVKFLLLAGIICAVMIDIGDVVWWQIDWQWKIYQAFYHVTAWTITAFILAKFIEPPQNKPSESG